MTAVDPRERGAAARVGTSIRGKYRIQRILGVGGMATVYAAEHRNGHRVAVKILHPVLSHHKETCARFLREGYVANKLRHAGAVRVLDDDLAEDGAAFLVMELLEGETLRALCRRAGGRLPCRDVLALGHQLLDVLDAAHAVGVVHRDVKPENLFLTTAGVLKVLDFGIARLEDDGALTTVIGTRLGTPAFMPPELALGRTAEIDGRTDLWSTGATLFQLLSGQIVHDAPGSAEIMVLAATVPARSLGAVAPEVPAPVVALIDRALAFAREDRWPSARAMALAVEDAHAAAYGAPLVPTSLSIVPEATPVIDAEAATLDASPAPSAVGSTVADPGPTLSLSSTRSKLTSIATRRTGPPPAAPPQRRARPALAALVTGALGAAGVVALILSRRVPPGGSPAAAPADGPCPPGMALIPGGSFAMGDAEGRPDEQPVHPVEVRAFCLDVDEVTAGAYASCAQSRACPPVPVTVERPDLTDADRLGESAACNGTRGERLGHPVNCVNHAAATRYCASLGRRLPTEEEWEYAARGGAEQRRYPWGDTDPDPTRLNACDRACWEFFRDFGRPWGYMFDARDGFQRTAPVGRFRAGDSRWGVHDLAGNVNEWTSSAYCPYPSSTCASPYRVYRGGGWAAVMKTTVQAGWRGWARPEVRESDVGFRCAVSAPP